MLGGFVFIGRGFGKIRTSNYFVGYYRLLVYAILEIVAIVTLEGPATDAIEVFLRTQVIYISGITTFMLGSFVVWFTHTLDFKITHDYRWVFPLVCYGITIFNFLTYNFEGLGLSPSDVPMISFILVLAFLIVTAYVVWKAFGAKRKRY
jgi:hypothetical protein